MSSSNPIKASDLYQDDGAITQAITQMETLREVYVKNLEVINKDAQKLTESLKVVNITTKEGKAVAEQAAIDAEKLKAAQKQYSTALNDTNTKIRALTEAKRADITQQKLQQKAAESAAGSYNQLSASYSLAKMKLNAMSEAERKGTVSGQALEKQARKTYEQMSNLQKATGKYTLDVGQYQNGLNSLTGAIGVTTGIAGAVLLGKEIFNDAKELQSLNLALQAVTETQSNFAEQQVFLAGVAQRHGVEINSLTKQYTAFYVAAKDKMAGSEIQQVFEDISRSGSALGLNNEALGRSFTAVNQMLSKGTVSSEELRGQLAESLPGAVQAMTKAVQILHPEIKNLTEKGLFEMIKAGDILATEVLPETARQLALITGADKAEGIDTLTKSTNRLKNEWTKMVDSINNTNTSGFGVFVKKIVGGLTTILQFTNLLFKDEKQLSEYFQTLGKSKGLEEYQAVMKNISTVSKEQQESTKKALLERERETIRVNMAIVADEKKKRASLIGGDRAFMHLQTKMEEDALVRIGKSSAIIKKLKESQNETAKTPAAAAEKTETDKQRAAREKREQAARDRALKAAQKHSNDLAKDEADLDKLRLELARKSQEEKIKGIADDYTRERALINFEYDNKIEDLKTNIQKEQDEINKLKKGITSNSSSAEEVASFKKQLEDRLAIQSSYNALLENEEGVRIVKLNDLEEKNTKNIKSNLKNQFDDKVSIYDEEKKLKESEIDILKVTEEEKTKLRLQAEKDRLLKIIALNETMGGQLSDLQIEQMRNVIAKIDQDMAKKAGGEKTDIYSLIGLKLDNEQKQAVSDSVSFAMDNVTAMFDQKVAVADALVQKTQEETSAAQSRYDQEVEARNNGYANNVLAAQKDLELKKKQEADALREKEKAQKAQEKIDTAMQVSGLITASVNIWKSLSGIPIYGTVLALAAVGVMWGSFAASKIKAKSAAKQQYGDGGYEFLDGGSHASGNDIGIGTTKSGKQRTAEGGETLAIIKKSSTSKYKGIIPGIINSLNKGTFEKTYSSAFIPAEEMPSMVFNTGFDSPDLKRIEEDLSTIRKRGEKQRYKDSDGNLVVKYKNVTRKYV
jgi:tape measure domain-containing protein